jgi:hypothetical protein
MKKIGALIAGSLIFFAAIAADRQPVVTISANNNYDLRIDGRFYSNSGDIALSRGYHEVEVYRVRKAFLGKRRILVSKNSFNLGDNDIQIYVDQNGDSRIRESRNYSNRQDRRFEDRRYNGVGGRNKKDRDGEFENNGERGRGNKYGHNKNKKQGNHSDNNHDDNDDR